MALIHNRFEVVASFTETSGKTTDRTYTAGPQITTSAQLLAAWLLLQPKVQAMTDAVISSYALKDVFIEDALTLPAAAENNNQALFTGKIIGDPTESAIVSVPAIKASLMVSPTGAGYDIVDTGDPVVIAFVDAFDSTTAQGDWTISDGENWDNASVAGRRRNTKSTNS